MTPDLSHLAVAARERALASNEERIAHVHTERWIGHPRAEYLVDRLEALHTFPRGGRMPCVLIHGDSGIGKSMLVEKFRRSHRPHWDPTARVEVHSVVVVATPPAPHERRLYAAILDALHAPHRQYAPIDALESLALGLLRRVTVRVLVLDEVQHLLAGTQREQRRALNAIKGLANRLRASVVAVGMPEAVQAFQTDPQIVSRFEPLELPRWTETDAFRAFLAALARELPLRKRSTLTDQACTQLLLRRSEGITGRVCALVGLAAEEAIRTGSEHIDVALIERVSQRFWVTRP